MTPEIQIIIPAAGASERLGTCKQDIEIGDTTVWQKVVTAACETGHPVTLVTGFWRPTETPPTNCRVLHNEHWQVGMGSSIALAVNKIQEPTKGYLILLADQWGLGASALQRFIDEWDGAAVKTATDGDYSGPPVLFPGELRMLLMELTGDQGAKHLMPALQPEKTPLKNAAFDLDTYEDITYMLNYFAASN